MSERNSLKAETNNVLTEEQKAVQIPYFAHEGDMSRLDRMNKRLWILLIIVIVALIGSNVGWVIYEMQYETYYYEQEVDSGNAEAKAFLNTGEGDINYYGEDTTGSQGAGEEKQQ